MPGIEVLEKELDEAEANIEGLQESIRVNRASDLVKIITPTGKMKGDITGLTPHQYREFIGRSPDPKLLRKLEDQTTGKIPWNLILDQLAGERGFESDEELKDAIISVKDEQGQLEDMKHHRDVLIDDIKAKIKKELVEVRTIVMERQSEMFPRETYKEEVTAVNGSEITAHRQHPYWTIEVDLDNDGKIDHRFTIRYAKDARRLIQVAIGDIRRKRMLALKGRRKTRYAPKRRARRPMLSAMVGLSRPRR